MRLVALVKNVLKELLHERVYLVGLMVAFLIVGMSLILGEMTFAEANKIIADFGFLAVFLIIQFITIFSGAFGMQKEMEKQTLLLMLARPVSRSSFLLARFLGVTLYNLVITLGLSSVVYFLLKGSSIEFLKVQAVGFVLWAQTVAILGFVFMCAQAVRPSLAAGMAAVVLLLGHWLGDLKFFAIKSGQVSFMLAVDALHWVVPHFYKMNVKSWYAVSEGIPVEVGVWALAQCLVWAAMTFWIATISFRRKDLV